NMIINSIEIKELYGYMSKKILFKDMNYLVGINGSGKSSILRIILAFLKKDVTFFKKLNFNEIKLTIDTKEYILHKIGDKLSCCKSINLEEQLIEKKEELKSIEEGMEEKITIFQDKLKNFEDKIEKMEKEKKKLEKIQNEMEKDPLALKNYKNLRASIEELKTLKDLWQERIEITVLSNEIEEKNFKIKKIKGDIEELSNKKIEIFEEKELFSDLDNKFSRLVFPVGIEKKYDLVALEEIFDKLKSNEESSKIKRDILKTISPIEKISDILRDKTDEYLREINVQSQSENKDTTENKVLKEIREFEEIINLFLKESNKRFIFDVKEARFQIEILDRNNKVIGALSTNDLTVLSSGEQQIFILMTMLFFNLKDGAVILIDEPEKSMHIAWQLKFMEAIKKIISRAKEVQLILATHSVDMLEEEEITNFIPIYPYNIVEEK
ncbi:MAG: AAA family ATPase, partial [Fusobacterium mortiferum]|nr:AAA family ATPase [Fusobacterium mortiferum]